MKVALRTALPVLIALLSIAPALGAPGAATLVSPNGAGTSSTPTFTWNAVSGTAEYLLWVDDSSGNKIQTWYTAAAVGCGAGTGTCSVAPGVTLANGAARWWIRTWDSTGYGPWSASLAFTVGTPTAPATPTLLAPSGAINTNSPSYSWQAVSGAAEYLLYVDDASGNRLQRWYTASAAGCSAGTGTCSINPAVTLVNGTARFWVRAWNTFGYSQWSSPLSFLIGGAPPAATLLSPTGSQQTAPTTFSWQAVAGVAEYLLWIDDSTGNRLQRWYTAAAAGCANGTGTCSVNPGIASYTGAARWWIRTWNIAGYGPWSAAATFNTDVTAPTVILRRPAPTAVGSLLQGPVISVTFSEPVKVSSVNTSSYSVEGPTGPISGTITFASGNTQAIFTPSSPTPLLAFDSAYQVTLTTAIQDVAGNPLAANVVWTFETGKKIAVGGLHQCARMIDGRVKCWGGNTYGQLGIDTFGNHGDSPNEMGGDGVRGPGSQGLDGQPLLTVDLGAGRKAVSVAAGDTHTCVIMDNGQVKCWGRNEHGALGLGFVSRDVGRSPDDMANVVVPVNLGAGRTALEISVGDELTCVRLDNGTIKCWGRNNVGQLGQGNTTDLGVAAGDIAAAPAISLGTGLTPLGIAVGGYHACARLISGGGANSLKCWGDNSAGHLGQGDVDNLGDDPGEMGNALTAVNLGSAAYAVEVDLSSGHTCARLQTNAVKCWGNNGWGQVGLNLGNGSPTNPALCETSNAAKSRSCIGDQLGEMGDALPVVIGNGLALSVELGNRHSCAWLVTGVLKCWGENQWGELALGTGKPAVAPPPDCVLPASCVGDANGEIAALANANLKPGKTIAEFSAGGFVGCVLNTDGTIQCWGRNNFGQIGLGNVDNWGDEANELGNSPLWVDVDLGT